MKNVNLELIKEIENRSIGTLREIAISILEQIGEDHASEDRIKDNIRRKVDMTVREEI